ncbi:hypothetical protein [Paenibacillus sp. 32O-W]|uniref:hypothetical protein n=1 Tax=Paenibacillus sp. 32O-W TaxID=1695218 RepID=UPI001C92D746|nr:hypothetical protein [Paenibacillus sp. 32O-W]
MSSGSSLCHFYNAEGLHRSLNEIRSFQINAQQVLKKSSNERRETCGFSCFARDGKGLQNRHSGNFKPPLSAKIKICGTEHDWKTVVKIGQVHVMKLNESEELMKRR